MPRQTTIDPHNQSQHTEYFDWKGPSMTLPQESTSMAFQNVHGLHSKQQHMDDSLHEMVTYMETHNISLLGLSEHHIAMSNPQWRQRLHNTVTKIRPGHITHQFNSSPDHASNGRLMGGTGIIAMDKITGRIQPDGKGGDIMGRWSFMHLRRHHLPPLTVISVYQVCQTPTNAIGDTSWHQQRRYLDLHNREEHPRRAFMNDLIAYVQTLQDKHHSIIIGGDWNDWLGSPRSQLLQMCTTLNLIDPWLSSNPNDSDFATFEQGKHRIDSIFISQDIYHSVTSIRYTPGGAICSTDHRAVIIDFHTKTLFGTTISPPQVLTPRGARSKDKRAVTTFIEAMHHHLKAQNAFERSKILDTKNDDDHRLVEIIDQLVGEAGDVGEKRCRRRREPWYSTQITTSRRIVSLLRYYINGLKVQIDRRKTIHTRLQSLHCNVTLPTDINLAKVLLKTYETNLLILSRESDTQRSTELEQTAIQSEAIGQPKHARILRNINKHEQNIKTWKILSFMDNKGKTQRLDRLDIPASWPSPTQGVSVSTPLEDPKEATVWRTVTDPQDIEHYLMLRNCQHFGQAHGTPFTIPPLSNEIDWTATTRASEEVLSGTYTNTTQLTELCKQLLHQCHSHTDLNSVKPYLSEDDFTGKIQKWKELTSTSPSGRHLGRYKALLATGSYSPETQEHSTFQTKQGDIISIILRIINYCINTGYPLLRWRQVINTMIFKDSGVYRIHRLRVIHIYEADLNLIYAVKWRQLLKHADDRGLIHPGQYGGRNGCEATSMALHEELRLDISYTTRRTLLTFDNDAASCYDRMVGNLVSLVNRKNGLHTSLTRLHGTLLQKTQHKVSTALGVTEQHYSHTPQTPLYGTGQGAGNSPTIWLLISSLLFQLHDRLSHGATFYTVNDTNKLHLGLSGFVDDINAVINADNPQCETPIEQLMIHLQHDAQLWCDILHLSGGKLELGKCTYHALQFSFKPDGTPSVIQDPVLPPLALTDPITQHLSLVPLLPATKAHKILGHWKSPADPRQRDQLREVRLKANHQSLLIATSPLSRQGARLAYAGKYIASLRYVLPQCWFQPHQLRRTEQSSMSRIISKCGYAKTTPHALLFAPVDLAGAGFLHWTTIQGEGQVKQFLKHWRSDTRESTLLRINVSWVQWQAGTEKSILEDTSNPLPYLESRWLPSLRQFLSTINGTIILDNNCVQPHEREGDAHIMDMASKSGEFDASALRILNYCRLYLHVTTISELFNASGTKLLQHMFECEKPPWFDPQTRIILQRRPSNYQQKYQWQRFCRMLCTSTLQAGEAIRLGHWSQRTTKHRLRREAYLQTTGTHTIFVWHNASYWIAHPHPTNHHQVTLKHAVEWTPNDQCEPIDVQKLSTKRYITQRNPNHKPTPQTTPAPPQDLEDYIITLPPWEQDIMHHITWLQQPFAIMHQLQNHWSSQDKLLVVSDGSSIDHKTMSYGLVIGSSKGTQFLEAMGHAQGKPTSHRAECAGCLAGAVILKHLQRYTMIKYPKTLRSYIISDNKGMITSLQDRTQYTTVYPNTTLRPDWDLLEEIYQTYRETTLPNQEFQWVQGHQDRENQRKLSIEATFNIRADQLAGEVHNSPQSTPQQHSNTPLMHHTKCILYIGREAHHSHYSHNIRRAAATPAYQDYLKKRQGWTKATYNDVDWESFQAAARTYHSAEVHLLKLVYDKLPTNSNKAKYQPWISPKCHFCDQPETFTHLCRSKCNKRSITFQTNLTTKLQEYLQQANAPQDFQTQFLEAIHQWYSDTNPKNPTHGMSSNTPSTQRQAHIGWNHMLKGFLTKAWREQLIKEIRTNRLLHWCTQNDDTHTNDPHNRPIDAPDEPDFHITFPRGAPANSYSTIEATALISGIIKLIWAEMSTLWTAHLQYIHQYEASIALSAKATELKVQIRALHQMKTKSLAEHRTRYFFSDVEQYLAKATARQMATYVDRYRPAILHSVRRATKIATNSPILTTFQGFTLKTPTKSHANHPAMEEEPHRKHTRMRFAVPQSITTYFQRNKKKKPPPPPT